MQLSNSTDPDSQVKHWANRLYLGHPSSPKQHLPLVQALLGLCLLLRSVCPPPYLFSLNRVCVFITCIYYENLCYSIVCLERKINISYLILSYLIKMQFLLFFYFKKNDFCLFCNFIFSLLWLCIAEVSAIAALRITHWQIWKHCVIAFCALREQSCGIVYCGPEKHAALPTSVDYTLKHGEGKR